MAYTFDADGKPIKTGVPPAISVPPQLGPGARTTITKDTGVTLTATAGAGRLELVVESGKVRVRSDGTAPTATTGEPMWPTNRRTWRATTLHVLADGEDAVVTSLSR